MSETRVVNINKGKNFDVYIGRAGRGRKHILNTTPDGRGWLGNPYKITNFTREASIKMYKNLFYKKLEEDEEFKEEVKNLKGKVLGCFCKPKECHGDVIVEYLEEKG